MTADDIAKILDELGKRLGPAGDHLFALTARQVQIEAITSIAGVILLILATIVLSLIAYFSWKSGYRLEARLISESEAAGALWDTKYAEWARDSTDKSRYAYSEKLGERPRMYRPEDDQNRYLKYVYSLMGCSIAAFVTGLSALLFLMTSFLFWVTALTNPEYAALQRILSLLPAVK
jgi:hypothetical protein